MRIQGYIIALFVGLLFVKVSAFHVYAHESADNPIEVCGYCDLAVENQQFELTPNFSEVKVPAPPSDELETQIEQPPIGANSIHFSSLLFSRPPPVLG